jgi:hypothetical protein
MRRTIFSVLLFAGVGLAAGAPTMPAHSTATTDVIELLSAIDFLPGTGDLNRAMNSDLSVLTQLANSEEGDPGVRLRAYRSLGDYDEPAAHQALIIAIERYRTEESGTELLYLIAATEALGQISVPEDVPVLGLLLNASSRDLRVVAARALGRVANDEACQLLRERRGTPSQPVESVDQVKIAIDAAAATCI